MPSSSADEPKQSTLGSKIESLGERWLEMPFYTRFPVALVLGAVTIFTALTVIVVGFVVLVIWPIKFMGVWSILYFLAVVAAGYLELVRRDTIKQREKAKSRRY